MRWKTLNKRKAKRARRKGLREYVIDFGPLSATILAKNDADVIRKVTRMLNNVTRLMSSPDYWKGVAQRIAEMQHQLLAATETSAWRPLAMGSPRSLLRADDEWPEVINEV